MQKNLQILNGIKIDMPDEIIFISIKNDGTEVWRPMKAVRLHDKIYKIEAYPDLNSEEEELEFNIGEIVVCEIQNKSGEDILVATKSK